VTEIPEQCRGQEAEKTCINEASRLFLISGGDVLRPLILLHRTTGDRRDAARSVQMRTTSIVAVTMVVLCSFLMLAGCSKKEGGQNAPKIGGSVEGKAASNFTLKDLQGKDVRLADLAGKVVLLNFWATWCPPCREEIPSMVRLNAAMAGKPFQMLCVAIDDGGKADVDAFLARQKITLPALLDPTSEVAKQYGITGVPETFVIDKTGKIVKKVVGGLDWNSPEVVTFLTDLASK
jgi:peroxiredoxin